MSPPTACSEAVVDTVESLRHRLHAISEAFDCAICHATLRAPVHLPCGHMLCSECARRHLSSASVCPQPFCKSPATATALTPLRALDAALDAVRGSKARTAPATREEGTRLVFLSRKDPRAKARFIERLRANELPMTGSVDALAARDREFVIRWNANLDAAVPRSRKEIAEEVMADERHRDRERRKAAHASSVAFFSTKPKAADDPDVPVEGDDFSSLIRKTRARKERLKRERKESDADKVETMPAEKIPRLGPTERGGGTANGTGSPDGNIDADATVDVGRKAELAAFDVDADTLIIPPSPPSLPPSPSETSPLREDGKKPSPGVQGDRDAVIAERSAARSDAGMLHGKQEMTYPDVGCVSANPAVSGNAADASSFPLMGASAVASKSPLNAPRSAAAHTQSPANGSNAASTQPQMDIAGSGGQPGRPSSRATPPFSEEQLRRIERNRQIAIERKKLYFQRLRREQMRQPDF